MSCQGYTLSFKPKKNRLPNDLSRNYFKTFLAQISDYTLFLREFLPTGQRTSDNVHIEDLNHDQSVKQLKSSIDAILNLSPCRIICAPSEELKSHQHDILFELQRIPVHKNAHGFIRGRDALSCASAHLHYWGQRPKGLVLLNADVEGFFHSISEAQVKLALEKHGILAANASAICGFCMLRSTPELALEAIQQLGGVLRYPKNETKATLAAVKDVLTWEHPVTNRYRHLILQTLLGLGSSIAPGDWFLPQGAPTSPVLSNLVCKIIDIRLEAMARAFGAFYTRYADDLTFSWPAFTKGKQIDGLKRCSAEVFAEYGMRFHPKKVRVVGPGGSQDIVGYVINSGRPTVSQKFRRRMRQEIESEKKSKKITSNAVINRLTGRAGYIQPLHPKEALWLKEEISKLQFKTNRKVTAHIESPDATEAFESSTPTSRRKVSLLT